MNDAIAEVFRLEPGHQALEQVQETFGSDDTTGDGCGESPPQGPTTGC